MNSSRKTDTNPNGDFHASEVRIDKTVSELFDELFAEISSADSLHNSEQLNRNAGLSKKSTEIYVFINSYHAFCRLCEQHFYTRSVSNDINSFFQKHINTSYHRQMRHVWRPPDNASMFTWEKKFHSGQCNVCQMSGLDSYIIDTRFYLSDVIELHRCLWDEENRTSNEITLKKLSLLTKYCGLSVFREKFIKAVNQESVCLLCEVRFPWTVEEARCHLFSDTHYQKFLFLIRKYFDFSPNDVLNGFNLEVVTQWLLSVKMDTAYEFMYHDEREICRHYSNNSENPYPREMNNHSYSPKELERLQDEDAIFIENDKCLLCGIKIDQKHMSSDLHRLRALNLEKGFFASKENFKKFCENRKKRLKILDHYRKLELEEDKLTNPLKQNAPDFHVNYFKKLFVAKLKLLNSEVLKRYCQKIYCRMCHQEFPAAQEESHLNSVQHKLETQGWDKLKPYLDNKKFPETFVKFKDVIICLLCDSVITIYSLYTHLKENMHMQKYERYASLDINIPISSALKFKDNLSCTCIICGALLNKTKSAPPKTVLSKPSSHWPCPKLRNKNNNLKSKPKANVETEEIVDNRDTLISSMALEKNKPKANVETEEIVDDRDTLISSMALEKNKPKANIETKEIVNNRDTLISSMALEKNKPKANVETKEIVNNRDTLISSLALEKNKPKANVETEEIVDNRDTLISSMALEKNKPKANVETEEIVDDRDTLISSLALEKNKPKANVETEEIVDDRDTLISSLVLEKKKPKANVETEEIVDDRDTLISSLVLEKKKPKANVETKEIVNNRDTLISSLALEKNKPKANVETEEIVDDRDTLISSMALEKNKPKANVETKEIVNNRDTLISSMAFEQNKIKNNEKCYGKESVYFQTVEKAIKNIVNVFENKIIRNVYEKSTALIDQLDKSGSVVKTEAVTEGTVNFPKKTLCGCACPASTCSCSGQPSVKDKRKKLKKLVKNNYLSVQNTENKKRKEMKQIEAKKSAETDNEKNNNAKVLFISGLTKRERKHEVIYSIFTTYGKIQKIYLSNKGVAVVFAEDEVAEIASKCRTSFLNSEKVSVVVTTIKNLTKTMNELPELSEIISELLKNPQKLMNFVQNLLIQAEETSQSFLQLNRERLVCSTIIMAVMEYFPQVRCYIFGSRLSGLTLDNSDLDVFLDCGDMYNGFKNNSKTAGKKLVKKISNLLNKQQEIVDMHVVSRARVPVVSFLHQPTLMHCDLSFRSGLSVQNSFFLRFIVSLDYRVKSLILFLKYWAKLCKLHGPPFFSSYALAMLVISYLEQLENPVVPTIESLKSNYLGRRMTIEGWDCSINTTDIKKLNNKETFPQLLAGLFEFYATYDYNRYVISPLTGTLLPREAFTQSGFAKLPMSYKRHVLNLPLPIENLVSSKFPICLIDPFDLSHVLTKSFTFRGLQLFKNFCLKSAECLREGLTTKKK